MPDYSAAIQELVRVGGLWLIPFFPAMGALINLVLGAKIQNAWGKTPIHVVAVGTMVLSSLTALYYFFGQLLFLDPSQRFLLTELFPMLDIGAVRIMMAFVMDPLGGVMTVMVTVVATAITIYSIGYMHDEPSYWRFFGYMNLFCFSMLMLVLGENFILMFFGWEGVGLCSYLLIGFWYKDIDKAKAGMKAFVVNRIGDFGFLVGMLTLFWGLLGVWDAAGATVKTVDDGRCVAVQVKSMPVGAHGAHAAGPGAHEPGPGAGKVQTAEEYGRCGIPAGTTAGPWDTAVQDPVAVGQTRQVYVGPTLSFREIRNQLAVEDGRGRRVLAEHLSGAELFGIGLLLIVTLGLFVGATGKSAQIPLYVWLPDAMAGPTPVSALIHAATMVTAGVYMIARLNFIFILSPTGMTVIAVVGAITALFAATIGLFQNDIKRVLAYSTVSQLGYMFIAVGVGAWWVGIYHLLTHAFFKACLFLGSGSVIHGMHWVEHAHGHGDQHGPPRDLRNEPNPADPQDMRNMGGLAQLMPTTRWTYLVSCLAISGMPLFAGFYSKDEILWKAYSTGNILLRGEVIWAVGAIGALLTAFYMFRSYFMTFHGRPATEAHRAHVHESPRSMTWVLVFLAFGAVAMSLVGSWLFIPTAISHKAPWLETFLAPSMAISELFQRAAREDRVLVEIILMAASVGLALIGILFARFLYKDMARTRERLEALKERYRAVHVLVFNKYFVDEIYHLLVIRPFLQITRWLAWFDRYVVDGAVNAAGWSLRMVAGASGFVDRKIVDGLVDFVAEGVIWTGGRVRRIQTGRINAYVLGVTFGVAILLVVVWFASPVSGR